MIANIIKAVRQSDEIYYQHPSGVGVGVRKEGCHAGGVTQQEKVSWSTKGSFLVKKSKERIEQLLSNYNPHHSWLGLTEQQNLTLFRGEARLLRISQYSAVFWKFR